MPEIAEVKLSSEFIDNIGKDNDFIKLEKSLVSKVKTDLTIPYSTFNISSKSRGKELLLQMLSKEKNDLMKMKITLGMSGNWVFYDPLDSNNEKIHKHTHLRLYTTSGKILGLYDVRRFAKWSWNDFDTKGRGPCLFNEKTSFIDNLLHNWYTHKDFKKYTLSEIMLNQRWFNGVGNYLRAEILYRLDKNPFIKAFELKRENLQSLIDLTINCCSQSYKLGGGQLKDWKNPSGENPSSFNEWMKCYSKLEKTIDNTGRTFWFHEKWKHFIKQ